MNRKPKVLVYIYILNMHLEEENPDKKKRLLKKMIFFLSKLPPKNFIVEIEEFASEIYDIIDEFCDSE